MKATAWCRVLTGFEIIDSLTPKDGSIRHS